MKKKKKKKKVQKIIWIFFPMNLTKDIILYFIWQITLQSDSGNTCNYHFIHLLCIIHSFSLFSGCVYSWTYFPCCSFFACISNMKPVQGSKGRKLYFLAPELNKIFTQLSKCIATQWVKVLQTSGCCFHSDFFFQHSPFN